MDSEATTEPLWEACLQANRQSLEGVFAAKAASHSKGNLSRRFFMTAVHGGHPKGRPQGDVKNRS